MMKYKLIEFNEILLSWKCPSIGSVVEYSPITNCYECAENGLSYSLKFVEDNPKYWQKIEDNADDIFVIKNINGDVIGVADNESDALKIHRDHYNGDIDYTFDFLHQLGRIEKFKLNT